MKASDKPHTEFISVVSHEMRTPLSAIQGYSDLLIEGAYGELQGEQREIVEYIKQSAGSLLAMIDNLLSLSVMNRGQTDLVLKTFPVEEVVAEVCMTCRADYERKKLSVSRRVEPKDLCIRSDRVKLQQILTNLVTNAIRYTPQGSVQIEARTVASDNGTPMLQVDVSDSGVGIGVEDQGRIFDQYYRVEEAATNDTTGMGVGLYIVRSLVHMLGGQINVKSELQKGSTFTVRLPLVFEEANALHNLVQFNQAAIQQHGGASPAPAPTERVVLLLGHDPDKCRILEGNLRHDAMKVVPARDMQEVVEKVIRLRPVAIIFDHSSSDADSGRLLQDLKLNPTTQAIPVLFFMESMAALGAVTAPARVPEPILPQPSPAAGERRTRPYRVLVTDDDPGMREALHVTLEAEGYQVLLASDGRQALELLTRERPDLMLLDLMMPGLNGWDVIDILSQKPELRRTKVLMLTGAALSPEEAHRLQKRAGGVLRKDELRLNHILTGVANALGHD